MSKNKDFSDTSVSRYSLALYELAEENNSTKEIEEQSFSLIDLISKSKELIELNIFEELNNSITIIEWPEIILNTLKDYNYFSINFNIANENTRNIKHNLIF